MLKHSSSSRAGHLGVTLLLFYFSTCCSLKCRTEDGPSESELKRITRSCMRKIGESLRPSNGGSQGYSNNYNHYGPLHQSSFGGQYGGNSRYDYNYDYDDDQYNANGNNNNYNNNNNNNNNNGNNNYDRDHDRGNRNALQQRNRDRQQNGSSDNGRSSSSSSLSSGNNNNNNNNNNGGRYDNNNGKSNGGNSGSGGGNGSNSGGGGGRNSGSGGNAGNGQRGHTQNHSNQNNNNNNNSNNNSNNNNKNANNDTADASCVVHCFFEELNMLNSDDYPDRYKVQYGLTRDLRDRELRNFYTDTIQDCFHYLESQRRRDKCHYSRDLINCMTEYAKVNCDDWQEFNMVFN